MLSPNQERMAYEALLNTLKASGVIHKDAQPEWPMLIHVSNEYIEHLNQVKDKPAVEPMDPQQKYRCDSGAMDQLVVYPVNVISDEAPVVSFVCESMTGQRDQVVSVVLDKENTLRLRNQLNQFLGE